MRRRCQPWVGQLLFLTVALAGTPGVVSADPVAITSSMLGVNWDGNCAGLAVKDGGFRLCVADLTPNTGTPQQVGPGDSSGSLAAVGDVLTAATGGLFPAELSGGGFVRSSGDSLSNAGTLVGDFEMTLRISGQFAGTAAGPPFLSLNFGGNVPSFVIERFENGAIARGNAAISFESDNAPSPNPEPATLILLGSGLAGIALRARSRRRK